MTMSNPTAASLKTMKLEALMADFKPNSKGNTSASSTLRKDNIRRNNNNNRRLEIPSFADQLALASSGISARQPPAVGARIAEDQEEQASSPPRLQNNNKIGIDDLRNLVKKRKEENQQKKTTNYYYGMNGGVECYQPRRVKSALKKTSSYGMMEVIGENIPISNNKNIWKNLPAPRNLRSSSGAGSAVRFGNNDNNNNRNNNNNLSNKKLALLKHVNTSPCLLLPPNTAGKSFGGTRATTNRLCSSTATTTTNMKRNVSFSKITVRDYDVTVGDAAVQAGPPVSLDWTYQEKPTIDLVDYEANRLGKHSRSLVDLRMNSVKRAMLLKYAGTGLTEADIKAATLEAAKTYRQRNQTIKRLPLMKLEDMMESATRKAKRLACQPPKSGADSPYYYNKKLSSPPPPPASSPPTNKKTLFRTRSLPSLDSSFRSSTESSTEPDFSDHHHDQFVV